MMRIPTVLLLVFTLAAAAPARAEEVLGLEQALALARKSNLDLGAARARLEQAQVGIAQARVALLPTLTAQGKYTRNSVEARLNLRQQNAALFGLVETLQATSGNPVQNAALDTFRAEVEARTPSDIIIQPFNQLDAIVAASIPLVVPSAYPGLRAARRNRDAAQAGFVVSETVVLYGTAQAFFAAAGTDELVAARRHAVEVAERTYADAKARLEAGTTSRVEVMRAELALVRAQQGVVDAEDARKQAYDALAVMIQVDTPFRVQPTAAPAPSPLAGAQLPELVERALTLRPDYAMLQQSVRASRDQALSAQLRWLPTLSGFGNFRAFNYAGFTGQNYVWAVGAQLDWVLYDGGARYAQRRLALAQASETEQRIMLLRDTVQNEVANAQRTLRSRRANLDTAERAVTLARETLDLVRAQNEAGTATQLDLLAAQDSLVNAEVALAQARFDLALSALSLERAVGLFPRPEDK